MTLPPENRLTVDPHAYDGALEHPVASQALALPPTTTIPIHRLEEEKDEGIDLHALIAMLFRRRKIIVGVFLTVMGLGIALTLMAKPIYQAKTTLLINTSANKASSANDLPFLADLAGNANARTLETQIEIIKSDAVQQGARAQVTSQQQEVLQKYANVSISTLRSTDIVDVAVASYDAKASAALADAIGDEYIQQSQERNRSRTQSAAQYVSEQLDSVRKQLNQAQTALKNYKQANNLVDLNVESQARIAAFNTIETALREAQTERAANVAQVANLRATASKLAPTEITSSTIARRPAVAALQQQLTQLEVSRLATAQEYAPNSPEVTAIDAQIRAIQQRLASEAQTEVTTSQRAVNPVRQGLMQQIAERQSQIWALEARTKGLQASVEKARSQLKKLPEREYQLAQLNTNVASLQQIYQLLNERYQTLRISEEAVVSNAEVVTRPRVPQSPISPNKTRNILMSAIMGLILALAMAALADRLDDRVHSDQDSEAATGLPVLAHIPFSSDNRKVSLIGNTNQPSMILENYRMLRTNIEFSSIDESIRSLAVTSSQPNEGKSTTAVDLAVIMALDGKKVILVDADLRRPSLHRLLQVPNRLGFTNVVTGSCTLEEALQETEVPNLFVLTCGPTPPNPPELLNSKASRALLHRLTEQSNIVIVDTPPALVMVDAQIVASAVDATILVVSIREANKNEIRRTSALLMQTGTRLLGTVLNKLTKEAGSGYGYGGYGYYGYKNQYYGNYLDQQSERHPDQNQSNQSSDQADSSLRRM